MQYSSLDEIFYVLSTGFERKGISELSLVEFINTIIPILNLKWFLGTIASGFILTSYIFLLNIIKFNLYISIMFFHYFFNFTFNT